MMSTTLNTILGISLIFICTTIGSLSVFFFKKQISNKIKQIFLGFASGIMLSASVFSLILPSLESDVTYMPKWLIASIAVIMGALFIWLIDKIVPHIHQGGKEEGLKNTTLKAQTKMFLAVTIHNIPEGLSVGIAYGVALASNNVSGAIIGALMLAVGIGLQNIPEGAIVSLNMKNEKNNNFKSFLFGMFSGIVEPLAAIIGLVLALNIQSIMPWALCFAAGCMLYVIAEDMIPDMIDKENEQNHFGVWSFIIGFSIMMILDIALG